MHPGLIGIEAQIAAMAERWSDFAVLDRTERTVIWEGRLRPTTSWYRVRIAYRVPHAPENFSIAAVQPRVQVMDPVLEWHPEFEEGPLPHVYVNRDDPSRPFLCLFDPYSAEWTPSDLISATTMHWTASHLYFYEGWLATGK